MFLCVCKAWEGLMMGAMASAMHELRASCGHMGSLTTQYVTSARLQDNGSKKGRRMHTTVTTPSAVKTCHLIFDYKSHISWIIKLYVPMESGMNTLKKVQNLQLRLNCVFNCGNDSCSLG